jgi:hypothetical protein
MQYGNDHIVSSHGSCSIYAIEKNGNVKETLKVIFHPQTHSSHIADNTVPLQGQTGGDFKLALGTTFCFQHDVRIEESTNSTITLHIHDDNAHSSEGKPPRPALY